jgi:hypothetical protein
MGVNRTYPNVGYGLSDALLKVFQGPIVSTRNPTANDTAQFGTIWVNKSAKSFYVLTSVVAGNSTWTAPASGAGVFTSVEATTGNITADVGNIVATAGNLTVTAGNVLVSAGTITATAGKISGYSLEATIGNIVADTGNVNLTAGNINVTLGNIFCPLGFVEGATVTATGDLGGLTSQTAFTNVVNTTQSSGSLTLLSANANNGTNAGFLKIYVGTVTAYVPYFTSITPA